MRGRLVLLAGDEYGQNFDSNKLQTLLALFAQIDDDGDGELSEEEVANILSKQPSLLKVLMPQKDPNPAEVLRILDSDANGKVQVSDWPA